MPATEADSRYSDEGFNSGAITLISLFEFKDLRLPRDWTTLFCRDGTQIRIFRLPVISLRQIKLGRSDMRRLTIGIAFALLTFSNAAIAQGTVKIGYIDPLSGGGASIGEVGLKTFQFLADDLNAKGGALGKKFEIVAYDNKLNAQETLVQVQKAIDSGIRIITQGNGSAFAAAIPDFVTKYNERNPGKEVIYFNYAAVDPVLTNDKCSFWH